MIKGPYLKIQSESGERIVELFGEKITIGRLSDNDIILESRRVSRHHACLSLKDKKYYIEDLNSLNGVILNGVKVKNSVLNHGDIIELGGFVLKFFEHEQRESPDLQEQPVPIDILEHSLKQEKLTDKFKTLFESLKAELNPESLELLTEFSTQIFKTDKTLQRLSTLLEITKVLSEIREFDALLSSMMDLALVALSAERGFIMLKDEEGFKIRVARNMAEDTGMDRAISKSIATTVYQTRQGIVTSNAMTDDRFAKQDSIISNKIRSVICVPLIFRDNIKGVIYLDNRSKIGAFDPVDLEFLQAFATHAAITLENAALVNAIKKEKEKMEKIVESMPDGLFVFDFRGNIVLKNLIAEKYFKKYPYKLEHFKEEILEADDGSVIDVVLMKPESIFLSSTVRILKNEEEIENLIVNIRNITDLKNKERKIAEVLAIIANTVEVPVDIALNSMDNPEELRKNLLYSKRLLRRLLYFSDISAGPLRIGRRDSYIEEVINQSFEYVKLFCELPLNIKFKLSPGFQSKNRTFKMDKEKLTEAFALILKTAAIFSKDANLLVLLEETDKNFAVKVEFSPDIEKVKTLTGVKDYERHFLNEFLAKTPEFLHLDLSYAVHIFEAHGGILNFDFNSEFVVILPKLESYR